MGRRNNKCISGQNLCLMTTMTLILTLTTLNLTLNDPHNAYKEILYTIQPQPAS